MAKIITKDTKPGKGISKDEREKRRFFLFFELLGEKFTKLIKLNFIYVLCLIPLFLGIYFSFEINKNITSLADLSKMPLFYVRPDYISICVLILSCLITGPSTAGFCFVLRNLQRREHAWVMSDFFSQFKKNFAQGFLMALIDVILFIVLYVAFSFYAFPTDYVNIPPVMSALCAGLVLLISIIFLWAHYYIYTIMVTFKLSIKNIIKNSVIFALGKLPLNLFLTIIILGLIVLSLYLFLLANIILSIIVALILFSFIGFLIVFSTYPTIDKLMLQRADEKKRVLNLRGE